jgi:hypothetical protein
MEIILKQDVQNLGSKDEIVKVKNGYARNYLIPKGYAITATESAKKVLAENIKQRAHKEAKIKADAELLAKKLEGLKLTIGAKTSSTGKIFSARLTPSRSPRPLALRGSTLTVRLSASRTTRSKRLAATRPRLSFTARLR